MQIPGIQRSDMQYFSRPVRHADLKASIRLYGERVMPMVQDMFADKAT
ncbi:hypothetical protein [Rhodobacter calidifons]|uniref:Uncharacterized protein n=1 Tax=Rhodobacter calidifons TaxID=2715277 RepID=A0ABX0G9C6_9RHOB|nr:hypothetical protein [Rhodobacter calidifons]NHB77897.1 hypothetical protein [Rhodobacter calidifons]